MKLSIIIPIFNEEKTINKVLGTVQNIDIEKEIILVDDGSTDGTRAILEEISKDVDLRPPLQKDIRIILHKKNMGKGMAVRSAIPHLTGDITIIQDADLEYDPHEYIKLVTPILEGKTDIVYGSRFLKPNKTLYLRYYIGNKLLSLLISILFLKRITDGYTCYKVFKTGILKTLDLKAKSFELEAEITVKLLRQGYKIHEVPISYNPRSLKEGKKINWKDALLGIFTIFKYRFIK